MIKEDQTEFSTIKVPGGIIILNVTQQAALSHLTNREWMYRANSLLALVYNNSHSIR